MPAQNPVLTELDRPKLVGNALTAPKIAIVVPTFNERENIEPLLAGVEAVLAGIPWEAVFVDDDSTDGTPALIRSIAQRDPRVRCLQRIGRRGLATACIEGVLATSTSYIAVMDADLQHDERLLRPMLDTLMSESVDIVIGSRYVSGGSAAGLSRARSRISSIATRLSRYVLKAEMADPMSGFFAMRRDAFDRAVRNLSGIGFKILADLFASSPEPLRFKELPFEFRARKRGESKLDSLVAWEYLMLLMDKSIGHIVPPRFLSFALVGGIGLIIHNIVLWLLYRGLSLPFQASLVTAVFTAMVSNFYLNNLLTYRDMRLKGWGFVRGFLSFFVICALGAVANVGAGSLLYNEGYGWWLAGGVVGPIVSAVWNYAVSSVFTWRRGPRL